MSDFLTNLASRSLDPQPVIRPRAPSRFEAASTQEAIGAEAGQLFNTEEQLSAEQGGSLADQGQERIRTIYRPLHPKASEKSDHDASAFSALRPAPHSAPTSDLPREKVAIETREQRELRIADPSDVTDKAISPSVDQTSDKHRAAEGRATPNVDKPNGNNETRNADVVGSESIVSIRVVESAEEPPKVERAENNAPRSETEDSRMTQEARIHLDPAADRSDSRDSTKHGETPTPQQPTRTVKVHIGRVEVRAVLPESKPRLRPAPNAQQTRKTSLDDYLKTRNGTSG